MPSASHADLYFDEELEGWADHITTIDIIDEDQTHKMAAESAIVSRMVRHIARKHKTPASRLHPSKFSSMAEPPHERSSSSLSSSSSSSSSTLSLASWSSMADPVHDTSRSPSPRDWSSMADPVPERPNQPKNWSSMADPVCEPVTENSQRTKQEGSGTMRTSVKDFARDRSQSQESTKLGETSVEGAGDQCQPSAQR